MANLSEKQQLAEKLEFLDYHKATLTSGVYQFEVKQTITSGKDIEKENVFPAKKTLSVTGPRFNFLPEDIESVFPVDGSRDDFTTILPHIILARGTLPWEHTALNEKDTKEPITPWLVLLLFDEKEISSKQVAQVEAGNNPKVLEIEVEKSLLQELIPTCQELRWLTHVRQPILFTVPYRDMEQNTIDQLGELAKAFKDRQIEISSKLALQTRIKTEYWILIDKSTGTRYHLQKALDQIKVFKANDSCAFVISNRLPTEKVMYTAYLVSVEGQYTQTGFNFANAPNRIKLTYFKKWQFNNTCISGESPQVKQNSSFQKLLLQLKSGVLKLENSKFDAYLKTNKIPLVHYLRRGGKTVSWYRGPLISGENQTNNITLPAQSAEQLLQYDPKKGMFDVTYAAAWELGRLLILQNKEIGKQVFNWKRQHIQSKLLKREQQQLSHLPLRQSNIVEMAEVIPAPIAKFMNALSLLQGVPFNYLIPDKLLLPTDWIKFFQVDEIWIKCLLDGAFSIGRNTDLDYQIERDFLLTGNSYLKSLKKRRLSGFLLRSEVVASWQNLVIEAYSDPSLKDKLLLRRVECLSPSVMLVLFEGNINTLHINQKAEGLHFGFSTDGTGKLYKSFKKSNGEAINDNKTFLPLEGKGSENFWRPGGKKILNVDELASSISKIDALKKFIPANKFTPSQFALQMIEATQKVSYSRSN